MPRSQLTILKKYEYSIPQNCFFGRRRLKKHSEKTEIARPRREQRKRKKAGERASGGTRKSAALSRLVTKRELARLARARKFVAKF